jgi:hypothetical protein
VIGKAATEVVLIVLASVTNPSPRASKKARDGTSHNSLARLIYYLSDQIRIVQQLHDFAIASILRSDLIRLTIPHHRKMRRKWRVSCRNARSPGSVSPRSRKIQHRPVGSMVTSSSLAPPSDSSGFWNPPWDISPTCDHAMHISEEEIKTLPTIDREINGERFLTHSQSAHFGRAKKNDR